MRHLRLVRRDLPETIAGTRIVQVGEMPAGYWRDEDHGPAFAALVCDVDGGVVALIDTASLVGATKIIINWNEDPPTVTRVTGSGT
jgi:hypothetical protein